MQLFRAPVEALPQAEAGGLVRILKHEDHHVLGVAVGPAALGEKTERIPLPSRPLSAAQARRTEACTRHAGINRSLAAMARGADALRERIRERTEIRDFMAAQAGMGGAGGLAWLTGYAPGEPEPDTNVYDMLRAAIGLFIQEGWIALGLQPRYGASETQMDLRCAKVAIDTTQLLVEQLGGEADAAEQREFERALTDLRVNFMRRKAKAGESEPAG